jgi:hypothetical protein
MTPDELMKPRYKVIAGYPSMPFMNNQVLNLVIRRTGGWVYEWYEHDGKYEIGEYELKDYPHLFKKMEWWEEREEKDMPEYVKHRRGEGVLKIVSIDWKYMSVILEDDSFPRSFMNFLPATASEYETYKSKVK